MALRRSAKFLLEALVGIVAGCAIVAGVAAWMLARGPVAVNFLTPQIEQAFQNDEGIHVDVGLTQLVWDGWGEGLSLRAQNWTVFDKEDQELAFFPQVGIRVSVPALFRGVVAPTDIAVTGVKLTLHRSAEGAFGFGRIAAIEIGPRDQTEGVDVSDFAPDILNAVIREPSPDDPLSYLRQVTVEDASIRLYDQRLDLNWQAPGTDFVIARNRLGLTGLADLRLHLDGKLVGEVEGGILFDKAEELMKFQVSFDRLAMSGAARYLPDITFLTGADLALSGEISSTIDLEGRLEDIVFDVRSGAGRIPAPEGFAEPFDVESASLKGRFGIESGLLSIEDTQVQLLGAEGAEGMGLALTANVQFSDEGIGLAAKLAGNNITRDDLLAVWPIDSEGGGRPWLSDNLLTGLIEAAELELEAAVPGRDFGAVEVRKMEGGFTFNQVGLNYLYPMPPVTAASGTGTLDRDTISFFIEEGQVGELRSAGAFVELYDLSSNLHKARMSIPIEGPLRAAAELLNHPRLRLFEQLGFEPSAITGSGDVLLEMGLPLVDSMTFDDVDVSGQGRLSNVSLGDFIRGQSIEEGQFTIKLNKSGMTLSGPARFAGVPIEADWSEVFDAGQDFGRQIEVVAEAVSDANRLLFGFDTAPYLVGPVSAQLLVQQREDGSGQLRVISDLSDAQIAVDEVGYLKEAGLGAQAAATVFYSDAGVSAIREISVSAPELTVAGNAMLNETGDDLLILELTSLKLGESDLKNVYFTREDGVSNISVESGVFDASPFMVDEEKEESETTEAEQTETRERETFEPLIVTARRLDWVRLEDDRYLENVSLELRRVESGYDMIEIYAEVPRHLWRVEDRVVEGDEAIVAKPFQLSFGPQVDTNGRASHGFSFQSDDMGAVLRVFDFVDSIEGGEVGIRGGVNGPLLSAPLSASIDANDYALIKAPMLAKVLTVATLTGIGQALDGPGLTFQRLVGDFTYDQGIMSTDLMRAYGPGLGITASGEFDFEGNRTRAGGTLVPAYALNQVIGAIPLLGPILTGGEGGGLIGVVYSVEGSMDNPQVSVNPLSALAPGFLRGLFEIDTGAGAGDEQEANRFSPSLYPEGVEGLR